MGTKTTTESSVLMNLNDLFEMEAQRREDEVAARERARAEEAARLERERREHEAAIRQAREQERLRAQAEIEARNAEIEGRIAGLRAELERVAEAREQTRLQMAELAARDVEPPSRRGTWIAGAMAAASLVAALTATAVAWPRAVDPAPVAAPVVVVDEPVVPEAPEADAVVDEAPEVDEGALAEATVVEDEPAPARATPRPPHRPRPHARPASQDLGSQLTFGSDDGLIPE